MAEGVRLSEEEAARLQENLRKGNPNIEQPTISTPKTPKAPEEPEAPKPEPTAPRPKPASTERVAARAKSTSPPRSSRPSKPVHLPSVSDNQASITAAFALIFVLMAAKHGWVQAITGWVKAPVSKTPPQPTNSSSGQASVGAPQGIAPTRTGPQGVQASPQ